MLYPSEYHRPDTSKVQPILGTLRTQPLPVSGFSRDNYPVAYSTRGGKL